MRYFGTAIALVLVGGAAYAAWYFGYIGGDPYLYSYKYDYGGKTHTDYLLQIPSDELVSREETESLLADNPYQDGFAEDYRAPTGEIELSCSSEDGEIGLIYRYNLPDRDKWRSSRATYTFSTNREFNYRVVIEAGLSRNVTDVRTMVWGIERADYVMVSSDITQTTKHPLTERSASLSKFIKKCRQFSDRSD